VQAVRVATVTSITDVFGRQVTQEVACVDRRFVEAQAQERHLPGDRVVRTTPR
jgi:hypothetical protein